MSSAAEPRDVRRRQEFDWSGELESPEELRLAPPPEEVKPAPPPPPSPEVLRRRSLQRQLRDMLVPLLWALACVGLMMGARVWAG